MKTQLEEDSEENIQKLIRINQEQAKVKVLLDQ
jgi:hypothetical protein